MYCCCCGALRAEILEASECMAWEESQSFACCSSVLTCDEESACVYSLRLRDGRSVQAAKE